MKKIFISKYHNNINGDFMIRHCPRCGEEITEYDIVCPYCGGGITFATPTEDFESNDDVDYTTYTGYKD